MIFLHGFADYLRNHTFGFRRRWVRHVCFRWAFADKRPKIPLQHVPRNPLVHPHSKNTSKQYDILITRGWKHWLYAVILTLNFQDLGFRVLGFWCLFFLESKNVNPAQGFEHVKRYAGLAAVKPKGCSEHVQNSSLCFSAATWHPAMALPSCHPALTSSNILNVPDVLRRPRRPQRLWHPCHPCWLCFWLSWILGWISGLKETSKIKGAALSDCRNHFKFSR